jgi:hypothetical protein
MRRKDLIAVPVLEAALIFVIALAGWLARTPLILASLGPTAFEIIETPERRSARPYCILVGNLVAVLSAFAALWATRAWHAAPVSSAGVPLPRVYAAALAAMLTAFGTLLLRANQPAALSTTLLISLGVMQSLQDGAVIMGSVAIMCLLGEPVRQWRERKSTLVSDVVPQQHVRRDKGEVHDRDQSVHGEERGVHASHVAR